MIDITKLYGGVGFESQTLRYGKAFAGGRFERAPTAGERRPVVVWNVTRTCNLKCLHCYSDSEAKAYAGELTTEEAKAVLRDLAGFHVPAVLFSGGEPLVRKDLFDLAATARELGLRFVLSSNGTLIDEAMAGRIKDVGFSYVGVSLDGVGGKHDTFRGVPGAFERTVKGIRALKKVGQKVGLRLTLTRHTLGELPAIFDLMDREGIQRICFYHLVPSGRGRDLAEVRPETTREAVQYILNRARILADRGDPREVLTVDNHCDGAFIYLKLLEENKPAQAQEVYNLLKWNGGGLYSTGVGIGCIDFYGHVHPDQFWMHYTLGNVRQRPFSEIWMDTSDSLMARLKDKRSHLKGKCATCGFLDICGGALRTRAEVVTGDPFAPDPLCYLTDEERESMGSPRVGPSGKGTGAQGANSQP